MSAEWDRPTTASYMYLYMYVISTFRFHVGILHQSGRCADSVLQDTT